MIHSHVKMEEKRFKDNHPKLAEITLKERHLYSTDWLRTWKYLEEIVKEESSISWEQEEIEGQVWPRGGKYGGLMWLEEGNIGASCDSSVDEGPFKCASYFLKIVTIKT